MVLSKEKVNDYEWKKLQDIVDQVVYCTECRLAPIKSSQKVSRKGRPYQSNLTRLEFVNHNDSYTVSWFIELFDNYYNDTIEVSSRSNKRLYQFLQEVMNDYSCPKFILNYKSLMDKVSELTNISFKVKEVTNKSGFTSYEPVFIAIA